MTPEKVFSQIEEQRGKLIALLNSKNPMPPNRISDIATKLAILNELLGGHLARLKEEQILAEKEAFDKARTAGATVTQAQLDARAGSASARRKYDEVDIKHSDLWKLISMAQTHIRAEGQEQK